MKLFRGFSCVLLAAAATLSLDAAAQAAASIPAPAADSTVLLRGPAGDVTLGQVRAAVDVFAPPQMREEFFSSPRNIEQMALTVYIRQALAAQARQQGFDRRSDVVRAMEIGELQTLTDLWVAHKVKESEPSSAQIEKYARSVYDAQLTQKSPDAKSVDFESQRVELMEQARAKLNAQAGAGVWNAAQAGAEPDAAAIAAQVRPPVEK